MKNVINKLVVGVLVVGQMACGVINGESCPGAFYKGSDSGISIEDEIKSHDTPSLKTCHAFDEAIVLTTSDGKVYKDIYNVSDSDQAKEIAAILGLVIDPSLDVFMYASTNSQSTNFEKTKTLTFEFYKDANSGVIASKTITLTLDPNHEVESTPINPYSS